MRPVTIEVIDADRAIVVGRQFATDRDRYAERLGYARRWPDQVWPNEA